MRVVPVTVVVCLFVCYQRGSFSYVCDIVLDYVCVRYVLCVGLLLGKEREQKKRGGLG